MKYVISADQYFKQGPNQINEKLVQYFESIPESFWTALDAVDFSKPSKPRTPVHSEQEIFEHQVFLLENFEDINDIIKKEDFLVRQGYDTIKLRLNESYLAQVQLINESVLSSVMNFVKALVADDDPVEMGLNVLRLVLDVIGIVPFSWAGFPIDSVANFLSAVISLYKGEYISMVLSLIAVVDVTKTSNILKAIKFLPKPILKILEKLAKILCRSSGSATELTTGVLALKDGIRTLGDKSVIGIIVSLFKGIANFFSTIAVGLLKFISNFIKTVFNAVPIVGKYAVKAIESIERLGLEAQLAIFGRNFETAAKLLEKEGTQKEIIAGAEELASKSKGKTQVGDTVFSKKGVEFLATSPQGRAILQSNAYKNFDPGIVDAYSKSGSYTADLLKTVESDTKFMASIAGQPVALQQLAKAAKVENELIGASIDQIDIIIKNDPKLAEYFTKKYDWKPSSEYITKMAKDGNVTEIKRVFQMMLTDPAVSKNLSKAEIRAFTPWATKPEIFIQGVKNFNDTAYVLAKLTKAGGILATRGILIRRMITFVSRIIWQRYGSLACIKETAMNAVGSTATDLAGSALKSSLNEEFISTGDSTVDANNAAANQVAANQANITNPEKTSTDGLSEIENIIKKNDENSQTAKEKGGKTNCKLLSETVKAATGAHCANFPGSTALLGGTSNMADDPKAAEEFQKKSTEYTKQILKSMGLDDTIDVQHALDSQSPGTKLVFSEVFDYKTGIISLNMGDAPRIHEIAQQWVKEGVMTQEVADAAEKEALEMIKTGNIPELKVPQSKSANEGLFRTKTFNFA